MNHRDRERQRVVSWCFTPNHETERDRDGQTDTENLNAILIIKISEMLLSNAMFNFDSTTRDTHRFTAKPSIYLHLHYPLLLSRQSICKQCTVCLLLPRREAGDV